MRTSPRRIMVTASAIAVTAAGAGTATAASGGDDESGATGPNADRARAAALAIEKGGTANSVERDDENGATWEVEVTRRDGTTVDVRLDAQYELVVVEKDGEDSGGR